MKVTIPYSPRPLQKILHDSLDRFNVLICHRRFGKTVFCINELIRRALTVESSNKNFAYIAPTIKQAKNVSWDYLKQYTHCIPDMKYNESELKCIFPNGAKIFLFGTENPNSLRGMRFQTVVFDEVGQMPREIWDEVVRPALSDTLGDAIFIGTVKGENFFTELYDKAKDLRNWKTFNFKASETCIIDQNELDEMRLSMGDHKYAQELENCRDIPVQGAYYHSAFLRVNDEKRIRHLPYDERYPVITGWDLGYNDETVVWFAQYVDDEIHLIDYYADSNKHITHYLKILKEKPYFYQYHILPHDARQKNTAAENTIEAQFKNAGFDTKVLSKTTSILQDINQVRTKLSTCVFDKKKCERGIIALKNYRSEYNERLEIYSDKPRRDRFCHTADAFRYLMLGIKKPLTEYQKINRERNLKIKQTESFDPFDF